MAGLPDGTVTFLVTDIEGSTRLLQRLGDGGYAAVLATHQEILRSVFAASGGREVSIQGDGFVVAFSKASDAVNASVAAQRALAAHRWPDDAAIHVRMGVHTGEPTTVPGDYVGLDVHRAVRVCAAGHGGQILLSGAAAALVQGMLPEGIALRDLGRHRLKDLKELERLIQVLHPDLAADFTPPNTLSPIAHNLPQPLTSFVGREHALATITDLLRTNRLVTLAGPGGCGKTRLALEVARGEVGAHPDGVWLVELASLTDPKLVPEDVAAVLNIREAADSSSAPALAAAIGAKHLLLVLDNCEHLVAACAELVEAILRACPRVRVLATSREPLGAPGERVWRVPSLARPTVRQPFDELARCESVSLFVERASAVAPGFALTQQNAGSIVAICRRLDGIPLALELAAARVQDLPIDRIAARLDDRFRLLVRGTRTARPRHRTLRATIDWSYDLLSEPERVVLRRLSVFAGGWSLEAAEAVCTGDDIDASTVVDLMTQIVLKSLAAMDESGDDARYRLLETVREYGRERLAASGETAAVRSRHLAWYAALAERAAPELLRSDQAAWLDRLEREHDNVRTAVEWALTDGDVEAGLRLAAAIWRFWYGRGYFAEGRALLDALLERGTPAPAATRAAALASAGSLASELGDYAAGCARLEEALEIYRSVGDDREAAVVLNLLGIAAFSQGKVERARDLYGQSLATRRATGDQWGTALCLHNLGRLAYHRGEYDEASNLMETSLTIFRSLDDQQHVAMALINLGSAAIRVGDHELARRRLLEGLAIEQHVGDPRRIAYSIDGIAKLALAKGDAVAAVRLFAAAETLRESIYLSLPRADVDELTEWGARARENLAPEAFSHAWAAGRIMTIADVIVEARTVAGEDVRAGNGAGAPTGR